MPASQRRSPAGVHPPALPPARHAPHPCPPLPSSVRPPREQRCPGLQGPPASHSDTLLPGLSEPQVRGGTGQLGQGSECSKPHFCHRFGKNRPPASWKWTRATCPENSVLCTADPERAKSGLSDEYHGGACISAAWGDAHGGIKLSCKMKTKNRFLIQVNRCHKQIVMTHYVY